MSLPDTQYKDVLFSPIPEQEMSVGHGALGFDMNAFFGAHDLADWRNIDVDDDFLNSSWLTEVFIEMREALPNNPPANLNRYVAMSLMQKGIRRSNWWDTVRGVRSLTQNKSGSGCKRRLFVISMEDVGNGDPESAAMACLILHSKKIAKQLGMEKQCLLAAWILCKAWKSRDCCDAITWLIMSGTANQKAPIMCSMSYVNLTEMCLDPSFTFAERCSAFMVFWANKHTAAKNGGIERRMEVWEALKIPPAMIYASEVCYSKTGDLFGMVSPFVQLISQNPTVAEPLDVFPTNDARDLDQTLCAAFDKHTYQGKAAIRKFGNIPAFKEWFNDHPECKVAKEDIVGRIVFYIDGAILNPRAVYDGSMDLYWQILDEKLKIGGVDSLESGGRELLQIGLDHMDVLNGYRT